MFTKGSVAGEKAYRITACEAEVFIPNLPWQVKSDRTVLGKHSKRAGRRGAWPGPENASDRPALEGGSMVQFPPLKT
jgi:hypothetical protein